ncbi:MAG: hypothetical protein ACREPU_00350 [Rhodanobacteraceae bacterium]
MPAKRLCVFAFTALLMGSGVAAVAHAAVTSTTTDVQVRRIGTDDLQLALGNSSVSLQLVAPGVLHVHYAPGGRATPPCLIIDPRPASPPKLAARWQRDGDTVTLRSARLVATWHKRTRRLTLTNAQGHLLLQQADLAALEQGRIVLDHAKSDALYGIGGYEANQPVTAGLLRSGMQVAQAGKQGHPGAPFVWSTAGYGVLVDCGGARFDLADGRITITGYVRPDADYYLMVGTPEPPRESRRLFGVSQAAMARPALCR